MMNSAPVREGVADDLQDDALQRQRVPGEDAEQHEAHVADAGVGDQALEVVLGEGQHRAVEDADHGEAMSTGAEVGTRRRGKSGTMKRIIP